MTIFLTWQLRETLDNISVAELLSPFWFQICGKYNDIKSNPRDLWPETWHSRHWLYFWQLWTTILTITLSRLQRFSQKNFPDFEISGFQWFFPGNLSIFKVSWLQWLFQGTFPDFEIRTLIVMIFLRKPFEFGFCRIQQLVAGEFEIYVWCCSSELKSWISENLVKSDQN